MVSFDVFISYSSKDKTAADAVCAVLEGAGIRCWVAPRDIRPGVEYGAAIIEAIDQCRVMILIFSSSANNSGQIRREIERAVSKSIPLIPVRIEEVVPTKSLEYFLGAVHWLDALTPPLEQHLQRLAQAVKALLSIDASSGETSVNDGARIGNLDDLLGSDHPRERRVRMNIAHYYGPASYLGMSQPRAMDRGDGVKRFSVKAEQAAELAGPCCRPPRCGVILRTSLASASKLISIAGRSRSWPPISVSPIQNRFQSRRATPMWSK
jgi:hypothetical protein